MSPSPYDPRRDEQDPGAGQARPAKLSPPFQPWTTTPVDYTVDAPTYELPLDAADVANLDTGIIGSDLYAWSPDAQSKLTKRGMVAFRASFGVDRFEEAYELLDQRDMSILVTADSTLHLYHLFFDQLLKNVEVKELIPMMRALLPAVRLELASMVVALGGDMREAARRDLALITVAEALLSPDTVVVYDEVKAEVDAELSAILAAEELTIDPILNRDCKEEIACGGAEDLSDEAYAEGKACYCHGRHFVTTRSCIRSSRTRWATAEAGARRRRRPSKTAITWSPCPSSTAGCPT